MTTNLNINGIDELDITVTGGTSTATVAGSVASLVLTPGGGGSSNSFSVNQPAHGFSTGQAIYYNGTVWAKAEANNANTLGIGVITVTDANNFVVFLAGQISGLSSLTAGQYYFVSDTVAGTLVTAEPTSTSSYSNPLLFALTATTGIVLPFRPSAIPSSSGVGGFNYPTLVKPVSGNFSWANQGGAVAHNQSDRMVIEIPDSFNSVTTRLLFENIIAAPYTLQVGGCFVGQANGSNAALMAASLYDSVSTKIVSCVFGSGPVTSPNFFFRNDRWNSPTSYNGAVFGGALETGTGLITWVRITDDGVTRKFYASFNGKDFYLIGSEPTNTFVTPNSAGLSFYFNSGVAASGLTAVFSIYDFQLVSGILPQFAA